jgi:hypothetical protein
MREIEEADVPEIDSLLNGLAGKKWQGCELRDLCTADLRHVRRVARNADVRYEITKLMEARFWKNRRRLPQRVFMP